MSAATYEELLIETLPARIEGEGEAAILGARFAELAARRRTERSDAEQKLMDLLGVLIQDYDRRNSLPPGDTDPHEMIQFFLEQHGKTSDDLRAIFGERATVDAVMRGARPIRADEARRLGELFHVKPGMFI